MEDQVLISIDQRRQNSPPMSPEVCIFRVPKLLREVNESAYEPKVLAIGPYHRGKDHLKAVEAHKIHYLEMLLKGRNNIVSELVAVMRELEPRARKCYAEPISLSSDEFVEMMLLDGCFILQLILMDSEVKLPDPNDFVFKLDHLFSAICLDLFLVENQLPFFVLWRLHSMLVEGIDEHKFKQAVLRVYKGGFPLPREARYRSIEEHKHLLEFVHHCLLLPDGNTSEQSHNWKFISCSTTLQGFGVKFEVDEKASLFNVRFEVQNGTLKIPRMKVDDDMEPFLRNLVAFEQLYTGDRTHLVTDFIIVMDYLIDSAKDVEMLCQKDIIEHMRGDNEAVASMFNKLFVHVTFNPKRFLYSKLFKEINEYCDRVRKERDRVRNQRWNRLIAYLKRNFFNSPWAPLVSVSAASILLLLTVLQTIFTILSYTK